MDYYAMKQSDFAFVYLTTKACNVCKILEPKLRELAKGYPKVEFHKIFLDENENAKGEFMAFTVPTFIVFSQGKELVRTARHISILELKEKLDRYYQMITN